MCIARGTVHGVSPQVVSPGIANSASSTASTTVAGVRSIPPAVWGIAAVITFGGFMSGLDTSLVNVGLDTIGANLGTSLATAQWITSGYLLALAAALPASGWLSGRWGSGRLWLWSLGGFTAASGPPASSTPAYCCCPSGSPPPPPSPSAGA
ncbi:MAG: MFS transporter [Pseudonocardia sp.]